MVNIQKIPVWVVTGFRCNAGLGKRGSWDKRVTGGEGSWNKMAAAGEGSWNKRVAGEGSWNKRVTGGEGSWNKPAQELETLNQIF